MAIESSSEITKVLAALAAAKAEMGAVPKGGNNTFDKYKYSKLEDYHAVVSGPCARNGLVIIESVNDLRFVEGGRETSKGKHENACALTLTLQVLHVESGQVLSITCHGEGQDRADKSTYKAITGARKYARACMFDLMTTDDPEADETVGGVSTGTKAPAASAPQQDAGVIDGTTTGDFDF